MNYQFDGYLAIGDHFKGAIKKVTVINHAFCQSTQAESISFSTTTCTGCAFCDTTDLCYIDCLSLEYYVSSSSTCKGK